MAPDAHLWRSCLPALIAAFAVVSPASAQEALPTAANPPSAAAESEGASEDGASPAGDDERAGEGEAQVEEEDFQGPETLAEASEVEHQTLEALLKSEAWPKRAIAAMRLERFTCEESRTRLLALLSDADWRVRVFAIQTLGRRGVPNDADWFGQEQEPRVLRAALRYRYAIDTERLGRGVRFLARSPAYADRLLGAELGAASGDEELLELARETVRKVILNMNRIECGTLSPRLAMLTGQYDLRKPHHWHQWLRKTGRNFDLTPVYAIDEEGQSYPRPLIARLDAERFASLERYIEELGTRRVDLAFCLDCTASMYGEITAAQAGIDDFMLFVGDVVSQLRVGLVVYRDRRDRDFETYAWDFTPDIPEARQRLWQLNASGGGDTPEAVYDAMKLAYSRLSWQPDTVKILILIGDAPPHVGFGTLTERMARTAAMNGLVTHVIQTKGRDVKHFPEIAEAGDGRCLSLADDDRLIPEIAGLTLGDAFLDEFREFFRLYLWLCR